VDGDPRTIPASAGEPFGKSLRARV